MIKKYLGLALVMGLACGQCFADRHPATEQQKKDAFYLSSRLDNGKRLKYKDKYNPNLGIETNPKQTSTEDAKFVFTPTAKEVWYGANEYYTDGTLELLCEDGMLSGPLYFGAGWGNISVNKANGSCVWRYCRLENRKGIADSFYYHNINTPLWNLDIIPVEGNKEIAIAD